jgi:hypothetical protein
MEGLESLWVGSRSLVVGPLCDPRLLALDFDNRRSRCRERCAKLGFRDSRRRLLKQSLILGRRADPALKSTGIQFLPIAHQNCAQRCEPEGQRLLEIFLSLLMQRYSDRNGEIRPIGLDDILVVPPYNVQVNYLKSILPEGARVGTVDKFQGQEAEVVLISMVTSSDEDLPRNIEFLYSRNRLNVAISRARCLAVILASPKLLEIPCRTIEQLELVNTLC